MIPAFNAMKNKVCRLVAISAAALIAFTSFGVSSFTPTAVAAEASASVYPFQCFFEREQDLRGENGKVSPFHHSMNCELKQAVKNGTVSQIDQSVTKNGVKITVKEILFDDARLSVGYVEHHGQEPSATNPMIMLDGKEIGNPIRHWSEPIDKQTTMHSVTFANVGRFPDEFEMRFQDYRSLYQTSPGSTPEPWELTIPVKKSVYKETKVLKPMITKKSGELTYTVKEIAMTPNMTAVRYEISFPKHLDSGFYQTHMRIEDEKGTKYLPGGGGLVKFEPTETGYSLESIDSFSSFQTVPESIKIEFAREESEYNLPVFHKVKVEYKPTAEKPIVLKRSTSGLVEITDIRYGSDKTEVRFLTEGPHPYYLDLFIEDGAGQKLYGQRRLVDRKTNSYVADFPVIDPQSDITFVTTFSESTEPKYDPELQITLPLKP
ncbi:DUF4179 domain-containing protein [Paenibacillus elgii]|uniref:DUF4179 domain-containing protein n=1 Tax=Paenibacillus elgii TaxID=189691 RepID=UPI00203B0AAC|nr:DUF4179 domain-containing protein [Paenibacillus elgii]MCM3271800.1 DUF4179 domain-containing protein [Paenibacillus elgii]